MDNFTTTFLQLLFLSALLFLWIVKAKTGKTTNEVKTLRKMTTLDFFHALYILFFEKPKIISGQTLSRSINAVKKFHETHDLSQPSVIKFFGRPAFLAFDYKTIHEINRNEICLGRGPGKTLELYHGKKTTGILINNDDKGRTLKMFVMKKFAVLGMKNKEMVTTVLSYRLSVLIDRINQLKNADKGKVQICGLFASDVFNVVAKFISGKQFSPDDPDFIHAHETFRDFVNTPVLNVVGLHFFQKVWLVRELFGYTHIANMRTTIKSILKGFIEERAAIKKEILCDREPENIIDCFLEEIEKQKDNQELNSTFCIEQLVSVLQDMTLAGYDTSSKFLECLVMYMCMHPDVQTKVQNEIDSVIEPGVPPRYFYDKSRMHYTIATFSEVHRLCNLVPIIPRMVNRDGEIAGRRLKKGTVILQIYQQCRMDETYWENPFDFNPQRFLDDNGVLVQEKVDRLLLFANGGRSCPGEQLANATTFTFGVGILQRYTVTKCEDSDVLGSMIPTCAVNGPEPFSVKFLDRKI